MNTIGLRLTIIVYDTLVKTQMISTQFFHITPNVACDCRKMVTAVEWSSNPLLRAAAGRGGVNKLRVINNWHKWSAFQSVAVQAVYWHDDSGPLFSLVF